jgi:hypothetical protein
LYPQQLSWNRKFGPFAARRVRKLGISLPCCCITFCNIIHSAEFGLSIPQVEEKRHARINGKLEDGFVYRKLVDFTSAWVPELATVPI